MIKLIRKNIPLMLLSVFGLFLSCGARNTEAAKEEAFVKGQGFKVSGNIKNFRQSMVTVSEIVPSQNGLFQLDTNTLSASGDFVLEGFVREKTFAMLSLGPNQNIFLILDTNSHIQLEIDATDLAGYKVKGSEESEELLGVIGISNKYQKEMMQYRTALQNNPNMDEVQRSQIEVEISRIIKSADKEVDDLVSKSKNPMVYVFVVEIMQANLSPATQDKMLEILSKSPLTSWAQLSKAKLEADRKLAIGQPAPEISLADTSGKQIPLSSLRGKVVLIDFWAAWCGPCRRENPRIVALYQQYKSKGFEIYGVSLDRNLSDWKTAIHADRITWPQVSDLKYWQNAAARLYNISSIPSTVLLDKEGNIVAKNLRGAELEQKIAELLN